MLLFEESPFNKKTSLFGHVKREVPSHVLGSEVRVELRGAFEMRGAAYILSTFPAVV